MTRINQICKNKKNSDIEKRISDTSRFFKETNYNAKVPANSTLILVENKIPDVSNCQQKRL